MIGELIFKVTQIIALIEFIDEVGNVSYLLKLATPSHFRTHMC